MSGAGSSTKPGLRQEEYSPLIDSSSKRNSHETPSSPQRTTNGSSVPRRTSRSTSRGFQTSIRSVSRAGTGNGEVLEVHFASVEQKRIKWWKDAAITGLFILSWFLFATILSVYNKWMFSIKYLGFPFPLFVTTLHMVVQWGLAALVRRLWPARFKPDVNPSKKDYATKAVPTAVATSLDIGLSNLSLKLITLSFYTMCKSSSLIFVLLFAFLLRLEKPSLRLIFVILLITAGVLLMVFTTTSFSLGGLILVLSASFLGGLRWGLTQILLKKRDMGMNNPAATVFWLAPSMAVTLSITSMAVEGWIRVWNDPFWERVGIFKSLFYLISPGFIAFAMVMSEYYIISRAGVVPMSIAGIFKEVSTIVISAWVFGDHLTELNIIGVAITITGIAVYTYHKYTAALHSAVPLDEHGNPLKEEEAEEVLAIVNRSNTLDNEEGLRLLEDGGELEIPIEELDEEVDTTEDTARLNLLGRAADGVHGDGEMHKSKNVEGSSRPLVTIEEPEEFESDTPVIAGRQEEGRREVGGEGNRVEWRR